MATRNKSNCRNNRSGTEATRKARPKSLKARSSVTLAFFKVLKRTIPFDTSQLPRQSLPCGVRPPHHVNRTVDNLAFKRGWTTCGALPVYESCNSRGSFAERLLHCKNFNTTGPHGLQPFQNHWASEDKMQREPNHGESIANELAGTGSTSRNPFIQRCLHAHCCHQGTLIDENLPGPLWHKPNFGRKFSA